MTEPVNWREELRRWCEKQPPVPLVFFDSSGSLPPELIQQVIQQLQQE